MINKLKSHQYFKKVEELLFDIRDTQKENIYEAGQIIANSIMNDGILQSFGSGHSYAAAIEIADRAGGLIPSKVIRDPAQGEYERIEGVGEQLTTKLDIQENDCFVIISNSGRNPLVIELAEWVKKHNNKLIVVTSLDVSKGLTSRHSSGKNLYEYADVILDNRGEEGDAVIDIPELPVKVAATSSISAALLLQSAVLEAIEIMLEQNFEPPILMSANVDGGPEYNQRLREKYAHRIYRF